MGWWSRLRGRDEGKAWGETILALLRDVYGARETSSGQAVTWKTALEVTTVLRCCYVLADGVATVPVKIMQRGADGKIRHATDHPLAALIERRPNDYQNSLEFRTTLVLHLAMCGNAYVFKNRVNGRLVELLPFEPARWRVTQRPDGSLAYELRGESGAYSAVPAEDVWHVRGPSWNGWMGMEAVSLAREAVGLSMATEQAHALLHKNGAQDGGLYSIDGTLTEPQHKALMALLATRGQGENRFKPFILDRGAKWTRMSMTGVDAQHLETRRYQVEEICRAFGVQPIMVGHSANTATYASAEQFFLHHAVHTIRPWHRLFEASIDAGLLSDDDYRAGYYSAFFDGELLRANAKDRAEVYAKALGAGGGYGWLTPNEVRAFDELNPKDGGDTLPVPTNSAAPAKPGDDAETMP